MTTETIKWSELSARERDELVALKVMGWRKDHGWDYFADGLTIRTWKESSFKRFQPSTDISAAWEVVEELSARGLYLDIDTHPDFYLVDVQRRNNVVAYSVATTAPEAICLAALKAVGVDIE